MFAFLHHYRRAKRVRPAQLSKTASGSSATAAGGDATPPGPGHWPAGSWLEHERCFVEPVSEHHVEIQHIGTGRGRARTIQGCDRIWRQALTPEISAFVGIFEHNPELDAFEVARGYGRQVRSIVEEILITTLSGRSKGRRAEHWPGFRFARCAVIGRRSAVTRS